MLVMASSKKYAGLPDLVSLSYFQRDMFPNPSSMLTTNVSRMLRLKYTKPQNLPTMSPHYK